jgi:hypothetical protein
MFVWWWAANRSHCQPKTHKENKIKKEREKKEDIPLLRWNVRLARAFKATDPHIQTIFPTATDTDIDYIRTRIPSISIVVRYGVNRNVPSSSKLNDVINFSSCEDVDVHHYIPHYNILEDVLLQILLVDKTV